MISSYPASPSSSHGGHSNFNEDAISSPQWRIDKSGEELPEIGDEEEEEMKVFELVRGGNIYSCTKHNNLNFTSREELMKHVSKHTKQHLCEECQKSYASKYNLEAQIAKFTKVSQFLVVQLPLKTKGGFYKHFNREHKCGFCNKVFASVSELEEHECSAKSAPSCKFCQKEFCMVQTCKRHIEESCLVNPDVLGKKYPYRCDVCGDYFVDKQQLTKHEDTMHKKGNKYAFQKCNTTFLMRDLANEHMKSFHT